MNIVSISWVRNEADVIETFVRHHCAFLNRMIIIDNRSRDDTGKLLTRLRDEGLPLDIRYDDSFTHVQGEAMTSLLQELRDTQTDVILPLDADEFLWTKDAGDPRAALERLPKDTVTHLPWRTYVPLPEDSPTEQNILRRIRHRKVQESPQWYKVAIPASMLQNNMILNVGSHALVNGETKENAHHHVSEALFLGHFPVRSPEQIAAKVCGGWPSHVANPRRTAGTIFQWKAIFDLVKSGRTIDLEMLKTLALEYATSAQWDMLPAKAKGPYTLESFTGTQPAADAVRDAVIKDPIPTSAEMRYPFHCLTPVQILAESVEYLAEETADLRRALETCGNMKE